VTIAEAERWVTNVEEFRMRLRGITSGSAAALTVPTTKGDVQRYGR